MEHLSWYPRPSPSTSYINFPGSVDTPGQLHHHVVLIRVLHVKYYYYRHRNIKLFSSGSTYIFQSYIFCNYHDHCITSHSKVNSINIMSIVRLLCSCNSIYYVLSVISLNFETQYLLGYEVSMHIHICSIHCLQWSTSRWSTFSCSIYPVPG